MMKTNARCDYIVALIDACLAEIAATSAPSPSLRDPSVRTDRAAGSGRRRGLTDRHF